MENVKSKFENGTLTVYLIDHVDSANAPRVEEAINDSVAEHPTDKWVIDADELKYISSVGLRIILKLKKQNKSLSIINVCSEVYEIFDTTGFTEMMDIKKGYRKISVEGCEVIGQGANGKVYRINGDTIVKRYLNPDSLSDIQRERDLARKAFIMGIPTAIPFDIVRIEESYGSVFELLNAKTFAKIVAEEPERTEEMLDMYVELLKKIHSTEIKKGDMPEIKPVAVGWVEYLKGHIPDEQYDKLYAMITAVPDCDTMVHGDYHMKNVLLQNGEALLIDMDTLCVGHPVFELAQMWLGYVGFGELDHSVTLKFMGFPYEKATEIFYKTLEKYFGTSDTAVLEPMVDKMRTIAYARAIRRTIKRTPDEKETIAFYKQRLTEMLAKVDSLTF